tara:strand:+ start:6208 stop:7251 length:1044 start_codon:yes stop_codon:yes gene_type:complete
MRKIYKNNKYKKWHDKRCQKIGSKPKRNKPYNANKLPLYKNSKIEFVKADPVIAPSNICLLSETYMCLEFYNELRKERNISKIGKTCFVQMDISKVEMFDYSSICVLMAIIRDLKSKGVYLRGNYPKNTDCKKSIIESGILTFMFDNNGKPFEKSDKSDLLFIEKGSKKLTREDNRRISDTVKNVVKHLTGEERHFPKLRTILLEICGNSIEWGGTYNKQWLFGVKYDNGKAIFTITDVGLGILKTLNKKFKHKLKDTFMLKRDDEILQGAFIKKYGSSSRKINRNKGLPSIKNGYDIGIIKNLKVLTNNVILHYEDEITSEVLNKNHFKGTLYRWEVTRQTILNAS